MVDAVDTLWKTFSGRMATINSARKLMGYMDAENWPPPQVVFDGFYLLALSSNPLGKASDSWAVPFYEHMLQFQWITKGTETSTYTDTTGKNRGNRVRTAWVMQQELLRALYPGFAQKQQLSVDASQKVNSVILNEPISWTKPQFRWRADKESGLIYMIATVRVTDMTYDNFCVA